jgi:hypothetical protein
MRGLVGRGRNKWVVKAFYSIFTLAKKAEIIEKMATGCALFFGMDNL